MCFILLLSVILFRRYSIGILFIILLGFQNILSTTGLHFNHKSNPTQEKGTVRLLSWNVDDFVDNERWRDTPNCPRRNMLRFIKEANADILCFQDFATPAENRYMFSNIKYLVDTLGFRYYYFSIDYPPNNKDFWKSYYGTAIFSKFPITDSGKFAYNWKHYPEHLEYATVNINGKLTRFYNTHLRSMFLHRYGKMPGDSSFIIDDTTIIYTGHRYQKLRYFDSLHVNQAQLIKEQLNKCTLPFVFCADLNSVPSTYVYHHISKGLKDAFLQNGFGWSASYSDLSPTLRIDVTRLSKQLQTTQFCCPKLMNASDHYTLVTDILIK